MLKTALSIPDCYLLRFDSHQDDRGNFMKTFAASMYKRQGLRDDFVEQFFSTSGAGVIRGMHFQLPPHDHVKLVQCIRGEIVDVLLDLRVDSPTFKSHLSLRLTGEGCDAVYIPPGIAHGFASIADESLVLYNVTSEYSAKHDAGVRWDSFDYIWPVANPILSSRDKSLPRLSDFVSPFKV